MKLSVSVPDELWVKVSSGGSVGPSEVVQRALRLLETSEEEAAHSLARAPGTADLESYTDHFNLAADHVAAVLGATQEAGYRLGLEVAYGLQASDLALLDWPEAHEVIHDLVRSGATGPLSAKFWDMARDTLSQCENTGKSVWECLREENPHEELGGDFDFDTLRTNSIFEGAFMDALLDVKDEAFRRSGRSSTPGQVDAAVEPSDSLVGE